MGIFLLKEDFGVIAIISILYLLASGFKEVGLYQVLQEHRNEFEDKAPELTSSAQLLNLLGAIALVACAPFISYHYEDSRLLWITVALALTLPLNISALPYKARLAIAFNFKRISRVESASVLLSNLSMASLAAAGAGIYSFAAAQIILTVSAFLMYRSGQSRINAPLMPSFPALKSFASRSKWLVLSSYMSNLATRGDYLVLSMILSKGALGLYYFSYQLMAAAVQLLGMALNHLLLPLFSAIKHDKDRVRSGLGKAGGALSLVSGALCLSLLIWFPFVIHWVWNGKWDEATPLTLIVTLAVPPRLLSSPLGSSALEAMAKYRARSLISILDAISLIGAVWIGALMDGALGASVAIAIQRCTAGMAFYFAAASAVGESPYEATKELLSLIAPYLLSVSAFAGYVVLYVGYESFTKQPFSTTLGQYAIVIATYMALSWKHVNKNLIKRQK